jgi:hypothetical protein
MRDRERGLARMADRLWYAALNGKQAGPFGEPLLRAMIARGEVTADTLVWTAPISASTSSASSRSGL